MSTFFDPDQRATVLAAMARIIPTTETPGAVEAGVIDFVDGYLSGIGRIYAKPDGSGFEELTGKRAAAWTKRIDILREVYVQGIADLDRRSQESYGVRFADLTGDQQDRVLATLEQPGEQRAVSSSQAVTGFAPVEPALQQTSAEIALSFFALLALHTRQGFYADPIYGGNRDRLGWQVIGFPGPRSLEEVHSGRFSVLSYFADGTHEQEMGDGRVSEQA